MNRSSLLLTLSTSGLALAFAARAARAEPCELATPAACLERGLQLMQSDDPASVGFFARACESKHPDACAQMGFLYMGHTPLLARDDVQSATFARLACELGSGLGCVNAAVLARDGIGMEADDKAMRGFAERSCKLDHAEGCYLVGAIYEEGRGGVKKNLAKASQHIDKACSLGDARSCGLMAERYREGAMGVKKDLKLADARFARACELGYEDAACPKPAAAVDPGAPMDPATKAQLEANLKRGTTSLKLDVRMGDHARVRFAGGSNLVVGAEGEVTRSVSQAGLTMNLVIGVVKVVKLTKDGAELQIVGDKSEVVIDGKKVDHWQQGAELELEWKLP